jgi:hypothetical protein
LGRAFPKKGTKCGFELLIENTVDKDFTDKLIIAKTLAVEWMY